MFVITAKSCRAWIEGLKDVFSNHKEELTSLDSAIGDADHGNNMNRGFSAVYDELEKQNPGSIADILKLTAMTLIRTVGGASGPLYGTWFLKASAIADSEQLNAEQFVSIVIEAVEGLKSRGKSDAGEKTMLDVWIPVRDHLKEQLTSGASLDSMLKTATDLAEQKAEETIPMLATKGRASFLGERSIGHKDPGAASSFLMIQCARDLIAVDEKS